jgi:hypothetical protein
MGFTVNKEMWKDPVLTLGEDSRSCTYIANSGSCTGPVSASFNESTLGCVVDWTSLASAAATLHAASVPNEDCTDPNNHSGNCPYSGPVTGTNGNWSDTGTSYPRGITATLSLSYDCGNKDQILNYPASVTASNFSAVIKDLINPGTVSVSSETDTIDLQLNGIAHQTGGVSFELEQASYGLPGINAPTQSIQLPFPKYVDRSQ